MWVGQRIVMASAVRTFARGAQASLNKSSASNWTAGQTVCLMSRPDTRYVAVGDADVAYQVLGEGPSDLLFFNGLGSNVEGVEDPDIAHFLRRLASLRRLIFLIDEARGHLTVCLVTPYRHGRSGPKTSRASSMRSGPSRHPFSRRSMVARSRSSTPLPIPNGSISWCGAYHCPISGR